MTALAWCAGPAAFIGIAPPVPASAHSLPLPPARAWLALARRALSEHDHATALHAFDAALAFEPRLAIAHLGRAVCLTEIGRDAEAEKALRATLEAAHGQEEILYQLARACAREGRSEIATALLFDACQAIPEIEERATNDPLFRDHPAYLIAIGRL